MRAIAGLRGDQARAIEAFLLASDNPPPRRLPAPEGTAALSGEALLERNGCRGCYRTGGSRGTIGAKLDGVIERRGEDWVRAQIRRPREHDPKMVMPELGLAEARISKIIETLDERSKASTGAEIPTPDRTSPLTRNPFRVPPLAA